MAVRGKVSIYTIFLVIAIGTIALVSFQGLKERKSLTILLVAKNKKIEDVNNRFEELLEATKKTLTQIKEDKESLSLKIKDLEKKNTVCQTSCKHDKEKCENEKKKEVQDLREIIQARESEIVTKNEKIDQLILDYNNDHRREEIKLTQKNDILEKGDPSIGRNNNDLGDENFKNFNLQNIMRSEKEKKNGNLMEKRNIINEDHLEDSRNHKVKMNMTNIEENTLATTKLNGNGDDNDKELETDVQLAPFDTEVDDNNSYIKE